MGILVSTYWYYLPALLFALLFPFAGCRKLRKEFRMHARGTRWCFYASYVVTFSLMLLLVLITFRHYS